MASSSENTIQIITTQEKPGYFASELLWQKFAKYCLEKNWNIKVVKQDVGQLTDIEQQIKEKGCIFQSRFLRPKNNRLYLFLKNIWKYSGESHHLRYSIDGSTKALILNFGAFIEVSLQPWFNLIVMSEVPVFLIVHSNPEIRTFSRIQISRLKEATESAEKVFFVAERSRENARIQLLQTLPNSAIIKNPVNILNKSIEAWPKNTDNLKLAMVGRLDAYVKGHIRLLGALASERWKSRNWTLTIFGEGPDEEQIRSAIAFFDLTDKVHLAGFVKDIRSVWKSNHVLLMPSMMEGMPLTLVEAMLCGRPALVSDVGGMSDLIVDSETGFISGSPFVSQLKLALERVWENRENLSNYGNKAHLSAVSFLSESPEKDLYDCILDCLG